MWYVVEYKSGYSGKWIYMKGYRTRSCAIKLASGYNRLTVRVLRYKDIYDRMHDEESGKEIFYSEH